MKNRIHILFATLICILFASCSSVRHLPEGQSMVVKNNVTVTDAKSPDFDDLKSYVRPVTNKKFLDIVRIKTVFYDWGQPTYNKKGETVDNKFKGFLRNKMGEPPAILDSVEINNSLSQLKTVMKQLGYFDATIDYSVEFRGKKKKKAVVNYTITANEPYFVSNIDYDIPISEYKKIVVLNHNKTLLENGMQYNESVITDEITRILDLIRNEGYYYVEKSLIKCDVNFDDADSANPDPHTVSLSLVINVPEESPKYLYKYYFQDNYVFPNMQSNANQAQIFDSTHYHWETKRDSANFIFMLPHGEELGSWKYLNPKTLANAIFTRSGNTFSQTARYRSSRTLNSLDNFDYINISFAENESLLDTINKIGYLDTYYRLMRKKQHSIGGQIDLRNDKSAISLNYTNRNLFKGGEHFTIKLSGGYFYYSLNNLFKKGNIYSYPEFGVAASLEFPNKIFLFNRHFSETSVSRSTTLNFGVNYSGLFRRLIYNAAITYRWNPSYYTSHSLSPIDVSTINNDNRYFNYLDYPDSYRKKFWKFFMLSFKYSFNYLIPQFIDTRNHNMHLSVNFESSGLLLKGLNALFSKDDRWILSRNGLDSIGYNYTTYEKLEVLWNYTYKINNKNSIAMRANMGFFIPLDKESFIPYEKGFYVGTSNSMRGWGYRGLGPGSYEHGADSLFTGDVKFEFNIEYRGTIYRTLKYGLFADLGNIWLSRKYDDMPGADFAFNRFYKELALDVGVGLRLDFNFFIIRIDYALPIYDPTRGANGRFINAKWFKAPNHFKFTNGLKIAIGYAF